MSPAYHQTKTRLDTIVPETMINLTVAREAHGRELKMTLEEKKPEEETTIQPYSRITISPEIILSLSQEIYSLLHRSAHSIGNNHKGIGQSLQQVGRHLYDSLFPFPIKEKLAAAASRNLYLTIDDSLVGVPWEIMHDGEEFWGLHFNMGRRVHTSHSVLEPKIRHNDQKIKMWILADPRNDLPDSYDEGKALAKKLEQWGDTFEVYFETSNIDFKKIFRRISEFDIIHYAGHAAYNQENPDLSGWHLKDGYLTARHIMQMPGGKKSFPSLIFSNACQSGQTSEWPSAEPNEWIKYQAFDLVNAFLRCGVRHYIGTFQDVTDPTSLHLGLHFYNLMMKSRSIGESLRQARLRLINQYGQDTLVWANYMLYGNPTICYVESPEENERQKNFDRAGPQIGEEIQDEAKIEKYRSDDRMKEKGEKEENEQGEYKKPDAILERKKEKIDDGLKISSKSKWTRRLFIGLGSVFLFLFIILAGNYFIFPPKLPAPKPSPDPSWEKEKWRIVRQIQEKLYQRFLDLKNSAPPVHISPVSISSENIPFSLCIIPAIPQGREPGIDQQMTELLIEEMNLFWSNQSGFILVERERLDFVLQELERATSNISEGKVRFALGKVFGARGILFVRTFPQTGSFLLPFYNRETKVFIRCVNTETTAVEAYEKASFKGEESLDKVSKDLGEKILLALSKR